MSFDTLLGNEQLKENLAHSVQRGHVSHFYLISGPVGSGRHTLAKLLAAAILCRSGSRPCMNCVICRRVLADTHPDFIIVDDPEKKTVTVDLIRQARADIYVRPNESDYKIYLFPRAQDMGLPGQNALLKVLEEPPEYGVFILIIDNPERLLPTVRSRCTELKLSALPEPVIRRQLEKVFPGRPAEEISAAIARSGGFLGQAQELLSENAAVPPQTAALVSALCGRNHLELIQTMVPMEKWKRDALASMLQSWLELAEEALACRCGSQPLTRMAKQLSDCRSASELLDIVKHLKKAVEYTMSNVSPAAVCGYLEWALR